MKISSVGRLAVAFAAAAIASQVAEAAKPGRDKEKNEGASRFVAIAPCSVASEGGGLRWANGRHPFQGGNGAYGDIFFGGGASAVPASSGARSSTNASSSGGNNGSAAGNNGNGNGGNGSGNGNSAGGAGSTGSSATVPTPNIGGVGVTTAGAAGAAASNGRANVALATPAAVNPEPASLMLIGAGLGAVVFGRRRARQTKP
jgi:hypothetical protein